MNSTKRFSNAKLFGAAGLMVLGQPLPFAAPLMAQTISGDVPNVTLELPGGRISPVGTNGSVRKATAIVNGEVITGTDVDERLALVLATNNITSLPADQIEMARGQVLSNLIDEVLQIQEASAKDVTVSQGEIDRYFADLAERNGSGTAAALDKKLVAMGSSSRSLKKQIHAELAWSRLLQREVSPYVNVGDEEVNSVLDRLTASKGTTEVRIGEIYLAATPENIQQVAGDARKIMDALENGASFPAYARQFSQASTASVGGDLGWVRPEMLPASFQDAIPQMQKGQLVGPSVAPGGVSILYLIDRRQVLSVNPADTTLSLKQISLTFRPGTPKGEIDSQMVLFSESMATIKGCGQADEVATRLGAQVIERDGLRMGDLPAPLQELMASLRIGEATPAYGSAEEGVRAFVLCGRDAPKQANLPTADQVRDGLEEERINKRAQLYLRDLRRDAIIEYN